MLAEIVLPFGTDRVSIKFIPELFATAIHPELPENVKSFVTSLLKMPLTHSAKLQVCGDVPRAFPVSINEEDETALAAMWTNLPSLVLPISESDWGPYWDAYQSSSRDGWRENWELCPHKNNPSQNKLVLWHNAREEYEKLVRDAAMCGQLIPRSPATLLPRPDASGEFLLACFVTVPDLTKFAAMFDIGVTVAEEQGANGKYPLPTEKPLARQRFQENEILRVIRELGYRPNSLPRPQLGMSGVKAEVRARLSFQTAVFDKAWERLRAQGEIADAP